jgi:1-acyl-sn-glycerol-3-phosphate acyltransferase
MLDRIATTAESDKDGAELRSDGPADPNAPEAAALGTPNRASASTWVAEGSTVQAARRFGWGSRLLSYFIIDPLIWAYTLVLGSVSLVCSLFDRGGRIQHKLATAWSWLIMKTIFSPVTVVGNVAALQSGGTQSGAAGGSGARRRVFAVTHASALDIPILYVHLPFQFRIVFKSELLSYPFVGWHLKRSGQVCINQQNPAASVGAIKSALRSLRGGMPLVIFPEGGRTPDGKIQPFLPGAFFLAIKAQAEIVPIALVDTFDLLPMNTYHIRCQPLEMRVGEVIPTAGLGMGDMEGLSARVKAAVEELHSALAQ